MSSLLKIHLKYLINSKNHFQQLQEDGTGYGSAVSLLIENYPDFVLLAAYGFYPSLSNLNFRFRPNISNIFAKLFIFVTYISIL
jgi:hypothetical protein